MPLLQLWRYAGAAVIEMPVHTCYASPYYTLLPRQYAMPLDIAYADMPEPTPL